MFFVLKLGWWWCTGSTRLDCTAQLEGSALDGLDGLELGWSQILRLLEGETTPTQALSRAGSAACYTQKGHREDPKHRNNIIW